MYYKIYLMAEYSCVPHVQLVALPVWATTQQPVALQFRKIKLQERLIQRVTIHRDSFLHVIDIYCGFLYYLHINPQVYHSIDSGAKFGD